MANNASSSASWRRRRGRRLEDAGDIEGQRAVRVDRLEMRWAQVGAGLVADLMAASPLGVDGVLKVAGGGEHARVHDEGVAMGLGGLVVVMGSGRLPGWRRR